MNITAADVRGWIEDYASVIAEHRAELVRLDTAIGDGDHGTNMDRGMRAATAKLAEVDGDDVGALLKAVGMALISKVGGAAGPLYGTFFLRFASAAGAVEALDLPAFAAAMRAGLDGLVARGKAERGDKTMVDALAPAVDALERHRDDPPGVALEAARRAADEGRDATVALQARKGRASYLGERSIGHQDPGATSAALLIQAATQTLG